MNESLQLAHPWVLTALLALPVYGFVRWRRRRLAALPFAPLQLAAGRSRRRLLERLALPVELTLLAVALLGLAGPHRESRLELLDDEGIDVMLVLDVSLSMLGEDFPPNRLEALREIARDFLGRSGGNRVGIVIFAGDAFVQTPLTTDHAVLSELLDGVTVYTLDQDASGGTAIGDALLIAGARLEASRIEGRDQALVLITDGESNLGIEPVLAARWMASLGVRFYAIGIGGTEPVEVTFEGRPVGRGESPYLAVLDEQELLAVTEAAGGRFFRATDIGTLEEIFAELSRLESAPLEVRTAVTRRSLAAWPALAAFLLFAAHLVVGSALRRPWA